jgi:RND family efflux transporter MFP subunit
MKNIFGTIRSFITNHKIISVSGLIILVIIGYVWYRKASAAGTSARYVLGQVERGMLISSVSGSGQVSTSDKVDIKPKVSGDIISVGVKAGQEVKEGTMIARIDSRDAAQALNEALAELTSAKISLAKTKTSTTQTKEDAQDKLTKAYDDGYNDLSDAFTSFSGIMDTTDDVLNNTNHHSPYMDTEKVRNITGNTGVARKESITSTFNKIKTEYETLSNEYKQLSSTSNKQDIENQLAHTYTFSKKIADSLKEIRSFISYLEIASVSVPSELTNDKTTLDQYIGAVNGKVTALLSAQSTIKDAKNNLTTVEQTYANISGSTEPLDVQSAELTVLQRQNTYQKALNTLSDYTIRAPFSGVIASVSVKKGDSASSATAVATLVTKQQIATISLNEIDAAKVKVGQKATITFDAFPDLSISGEVLEIDNLGTVSQGVVSYNAKIGFDTQDGRIKSGMSVSVSIITDSKTNVLLVPSSAVKTNTNGSYVEVLANSKELPQQIPVEIGSSNDTEVEIVSGISEGDSIITRTITSTSQTTTQRSSTGTLFGGGNRTGGTGGNAVRIPR